MHFLSHLVFILFLFVFIVSLFQRSQLWIFFRVYVHFKSSQYRRSVQSDLSFPFLRFSVYGLLPLCSLTLEIENLQNGREKYGGNLGQNFKNIIISSTFSLKLLWTAILINFLPESVYIAKRSIKCFAQNTIYYRNEPLKHPVVSSEVVTSLTLTLHFVHDKHFSVPLRF